jgi:hypothetical protein
MAEVRSDRNRDVRDTLGRSPQNLPGQDTSSQLRALRTRNKRFHYDDQAYQIENDLSAAMVVSARELDAIVRLLGDALDGILSDADLP